MQVVRIGFNGNDETEFDVCFDGEKGLCEIIELFVMFLGENRIELKSVDYIEHTEYVEYTD